MTTTHTEGMKPETEGYLIEWHDTHGHRKVVSRYDSSEGYAAHYEGVTVTELIRRPSQPSEAAIRNKALEEAAISFNGFPRFTRLIKERIRALKSDTVKGE